jgi:hypothetical protein
MANYREYLTCISSEDCQEHRHQFQYTPPVSTLDRGGVGGGAEGATPLLPSAERWWSSPPRPRGSWPRPGMGRPLAGTRHRGGLPGARAAPPAGDGWALACEGEDPGLGPQRWRHRVDGDGCARGSEHLHVVLWPTPISLF